VNRVYNSLRRRGHRVSVSSSARIAIRVLGLRRPDPLVGREAVIGTNFATPQNPFSRVWPALGSATHFFGSCFTGCVPGGSCHRGLKSSRPRSSDGCDPSRLRRAQVDRTTSPLDNRCQIPSALTPASVTVWRLQALSRNPAARTRQAVLHDESASVLDGVAVAPLTPQPV